MKTFNEFLENRDYYDLMRRNVRPDPTNSGPFHYDNKEIIAKEYVKIFRRVLTLDQAEEFFGLPERSQAFIWNTFIGKKGAYDMPAWSRLSRVQRYLIKKMLMDSFQNNPYMD